MVPLRPEAHEHALLRLGLEETPGLLALRHALMYRRPGLWGDDSRKPHCVILMRPSRSGREAFAVGRPEPAITWLASRQGKITLVAPEDWEESLREAVGPLDRSEVVTWFDPPPRDPPGQAPPMVRRLGREDRAGFAELAPDWGLKGWGAYEDLLQHGAVFGVPFQDNLVSIAWVYDQTARFDALGAVTLPKYRRLGLARAASRALIRHIQRERGKLPLWSCTSDHAASIGLARALGFTGQVSETVLRWPAEPPAEEAEVDSAATGGDDR